MDLSAVDLTDAFSTIEKPWVPVIVGELNGQYVKLAKFQGEYVWHQHDDEDEMFFVFSGSIAIHFRDRVVTLREGDFCIVPRGVEHKPAAATAACVMVFEPKSTRSTGSVDTDLTIEPQDLKRIS